MGMNRTRTLLRRTGLSALLVVVSLTVLGASPGAAAETYSFEGSKFAGSYQISPSYADLATARLGRVGITPIPIP